jgi:hypothetical protein
MEWFILAIFLFINLIRVSLHLLLHASILLQLIWHIRWIHKQQWLSKVYVLIYVDVLTVDFFLLLVSVSSNRKFHESIGFQFFVRSWDKLLLLLLMLWQWSWSYRHVELLLWLLLGLSLLLLLLYQSLVLWSGTQLGWIAILRVDWLLIHHCFQKLLLFPLLEVFLSLHLGLCHSSHFLIFSNFSIFPLFEHRGAKLWVMLA